MQCKYCQILLGQTCEWLLWRGGRFIEVVFKTGSTVVDAPKIDENEDSEVIEFIDKCVTCVLPDETKYPEMSNLVKKVQTHHHATTCRKKKNVVCRFNAPCAPSDKTRIVRSKEKIDETIVKQSIKLIDKYFLILLK